MRKTILAAICATAIGVTPFAAYAQTTGPQGQDSTKMGTESTMPKEGMTKKKKSSMHKSSMKRSSMMKDDKKM
jgi:hypothetical protein